MTWLFQKILGRMPVGWLQLTHNRGRLFAAIAGITFANLLVFVQLGIMGALNTFILNSYKMFEGDIMISAVDANTLTEGENVPRQLMFRALSASGIAAATPIYLQNAEWKREDGNLILMQVVGMDPEASEFTSAKIAEQMPLLRLANAVLIDIAARNVVPGEFEGISQQDPFLFELNNRSLRAVGTLEIGGGFSSDGTVFTSDQTFLRLFAKRSSGAPDHIVLKVRDGVLLQEAVAQVRSIIPASEARVRTLEEAASQDQIFQTTERPTGLIFGFGVVMGIIVGVVIVYQILSTDVADHLSEYATFKAMGYPQSFFLGIVFEQAFILAIMGFVPGVLLSWGVHIALANATGLPVEMDLIRSVIVLLGTIMACAVSGAIATRRLAGADPADLF